jgi:autotransporter-associated beta strand protein
MLAASTSHGMSLVVGNNHTANGGTSAGMTTASTITLGNLNISQTNITNTNQTFNLTSANGYKLQIANLNVSLQAGAGAWTANVVADAPLTVTGKVQQAAGSAGTTTLALQGGAAGSLISGNVLNSADGTPKMLSVSKSGGGTWTLSGTGSTYTGSTTITGGILVGIGANAFGSTSGIGIGGSGTLSLRGDADTSFVKASDSALYSLSTSAGGATIHVDQATVAGTTAKTMVAGTLTTSSTANGYQVNFSGSNHTNLSVGAMTGPANNSSTKKGTVTISNSIASTGTLTLASYTSANVGTAAGAGETLAFSGSGDTTVSGAITPSATTLNLTKSGAGKTTLSGPNTYTGATAVTLGTLALVGGSQTSAITVASGAKLGFTLGSPTTSTQALTLSAGHSIAITGPVNDSSSYHLMTALSITGTPTLAASITNYELQRLNNDTELWLVYTGTGGSAYDTWKTTNAPSGEPDADFDGDGVSNAVEFVLGGDKNTNDRAKLPEVRTSGANMTFSFKRDQDSIDPKIFVMIEVGTDLVTWPTPPSPYAVPDGATVNSPGVTVQKGIPEGGTDTVTLTLPLAPDATKFARLKVVISR